MHEPRSLTLSIIAPARNEADNIAPLVQQVAGAAPRAATAIDHDGTFEFIIVDDGSTDATRARAIELAHHHPWLRIVALDEAPPPHPRGQSAALHAGCRAARGRFIAMLDADLQNDPNDLIPMAEALIREGAHMIQGDRSASRTDNTIRKLGSAVGRAARSLLLADTIRDTGCSLRLMRAQVADGLPLQFKGMHRFIPITARQLGHTVIEMPVSHRPRAAGHTKYGMGIASRAIPALVDCFAIRWMRSRRQPTHHARELTPTPTPTASHGSQPS
ncbi:MAG: glycosyltransferase family 2 protein [Phycisphaerales bacterium]